MSLSLFYRISHQTHGTVPTLAIAPNSMALGPQRTGMSCGSTQLENEEMTIAQIVENKCK